MADVRLHGAWASPFVCRVIWTLKLKGIPYDYIEENLPSKSPQLLHYSPVHKKVPVLVHREKPICESMIIVEYIDEIWKHNPLLPAHPYERAMARFWVKFIEDKTPLFWTIFYSKGEEQEKAIEVAMQMFEIVEKHGLGERKTFFGGDEINVVDIAYGAIASWVGVIEEVAGVKLLEPHKFPGLHSWIKNFKEVPVIKQNTPDHDKLVLFLKTRREQMKLD